MKERRIRQPELFDPAIPPAELSMARRAEAVALLRILLTEAIAAQGEAVVIQPREVGNDPDRG